MFHKTGISLTQNQDDICILLQFRGGRKTHNEELHNLHPSPNIIKVIKSRGMRWAGYVARTRK
jgi:hypothetical protein